MLSIFPSLLDYQFFAPLILRLALAAVFLVHGYPKLFGGFSHAVHFFNSSGIKPAKFWVVVVGLAELLGGILLLAGFLVQPAAFILVANLLVAIWKVKFKAGFANGWEFDLVLIAMLLSLLILGPGAYSIDLPL
ncbi:DoxX family protein [Candidatus Giovannonibacteria bacterium]|nr:DoxX family protein [Candidatus Giovannonibacteria bacterium]